MVNVYGIKNLKGLKEKGMLADLRFIPYTHSFTPMDEFYDQETFVAIAPLPLGSLVRITDFFISKDPQNPNKVRRTGGSVSYQYIEGLYVGQDEEDKEVHLIADNYVNSMANVVNNTDYVETMMQNLQPVEHDATDEDDDEPEEETEEFAADADPDDQEDEFANAVLVKDESEDEAEEEADETEIESGEGDNEIDDDDPDEVEDQEAEEPVTEKEDPTGSPDTPQHVDNQVKKVPVHMETPSPKHVAPQANNKNRKMNKKERRQMAKQQRQDVRRRFEFDNTPVNAPVNKPKQQHQETNVRPGESLFSDPSMNDLLNRLTQ